MLTTELAIKSCAPGVSFFELIDTIWNGSAGNEPLHRICTMMRWMSAHSVVIEKIDSAFDEYQRVSAEIAALQKRLSGEIVCDIRKLTFLNSIIDDCNSIKAKAACVASAADENFLGYAIIINLTIKKQFKRSYVFEAIIRDLSPSQVVAGSAVLPREFPGQFLHVKKQFKCFVLRRQKEYQVTGTFFCQQNAITNVCAHACALMMLNNCKEINTIITSEDVNQLIGMDHQERALIIDKNYGTNDYATDEAISTLELDEKVFSHFGFVSHNYDKSKRDFRAFLYGFVESSYPALLTFSTPRGNHVVAVVGHTWNPHSWFPSAYPSYNKNGNPKRYLSSLAWINDFVVHDDNFGMQLSLPAHCFTDNQRECEESFSPIEAIGIFPADKIIRLPALAAEETALRMLRQVFRMISEDGKQMNANYYVNHLQDCVLSGILVLRTSLVERSAYLEHLKKTDNRGLKYSSESHEAISKQLGERQRIWLVEATEPDLYVGNFSKVIDIILDPTFDPGTKENSADLRQALVFLRFPEFLLQPAEFLNNPGRVRYHSPIPLEEVTGHLTLFQQ